MAKEFEPLRVTTPEGTVLEWPLYGPSGQPIIIAPHSGEYAQAYAERMAPNRMSKAIAEAIAPVGSLNRYGTEEGTNPFQPPGGEHFKGPRPVSNRQRASSYSADVKCPTANTPKVGGPYVPAEDDCHLWTINIQPTNMDSNTVLVLYVNYALGGLNYVKTFAFDPFDTLVSIPIQGRQVGVSLQAAQNGEADYIVDVQVSIEHGIHCDSTERFCPIWRRDAKNGGNYVSYQNVWVPGQTNLPGPGLFFAAIGTVLDMGGAGVLFPCLYDTATLGLPANGTVSLFTGPAITAANQNFSFGDEFRPTKNFVNGLVLALSSTPDVMTNVETATKWSQVKIGF